MKIKSYFLELRNRITLMFFVWLSVVLVCYIFKEILLFTIIKQGFCLQDSFYFIFTDVSEVFNVYLVLIFFIGNQVLFLYFCYHMVVFLLPGLFYSEYSSLVFIFKLSFSCFLISIVMYGKIFFPLCWNFFLSFQNLDVLKVTAFYFESKISEYIYFYTSFYYVCVFYFQILVVLFIVFDISKSQKKIVKKFRKFFYYFFIIFSTLVTPPDVFSQLFLSVCLIFSYEMLIFYFIYKKDK